jgi:hypothetical protein
MMWNSSAAKKAVTVNQFGSRLVRKSKTAATAVKATTQAIKMAFPETMQQPNQRSSWAR